MASTAGPSRRPLRAPRASLRVAAEVGLFLVTASVAVGFSRLFSDSGYLVPVLVMAAASHGLSAALRARGVPIALAALVSAAAMVIVGTWVFYLSTTRLGLPSGATLDTFRVDLDVAVERFRQEKAPTEAVTGFVAATAAGFWLVAFLADWSAFRLWAPFEATIPAGALFVFASLLGADKDRVLATALFFLTALAFLLVHRVSRQELSPSWVRGDGRRGALALLRGGASLAGIAVLIGALFGPLLPGAKANAVIDVKDLGDNKGTRVTVSPLVDIRQRLVDQRDAEVFTVASLERSYWRLTALDSFDGRVWRSSKRFEKVDGVLAGGQVPPSASLVTQDFLISNLSQIWLPAAYEPRSITDTDREVRFEPETDTLIVDKETSNGLAYSVTSALPGHTTDRLRTANASPPADIASQFLQLPDGFSDEARSLAEQITAGRRTPFDKALALQEYFRKNYTYSTQVAGGHGVKRIDDFLFAEVKEGYCEQFAGSFAALARAVGLPARVAVGFTPGDPDPANPGLYHVKGRHAHAWPEVYLAGAGWVLFEPTPSRGAPNAAYTGAPEQQDSDVAPNGTPVTTTTTTVAPGETTATPPELSPDATPNLPQESDGSDASPNASGSGGPGTGLKVLIGVAGVVVLYVTALVGGRRLRRSLRRRAARANGQKVELAWREAVGALARLGLRPAGSETAEEFARRAGPRSTKPSELAELAALATASRYSGLEADDGAAQQAGDLSAAILDGVRQRSSAGQRMADELDPRPVLRSVWSALRGGPRTETDDDTRDRRGGLVSSRRA